VQKSIEKKTVNVRSRSTGLILLLFVYKNAKTLPIGAPYPLAVSKFLFFEDCFVHYITATHVPRTKDRGQRTEDNLHF
jgi:hypothetical protein